MSTIFMISGTILGQTGQPVRGILVQAVAEKLVSETPDIFIGKAAVTNADGTYFIRLQEADFTAAEADILSTKVQLAVLHAQGEAVADSISRFGTPKLLTRDRQINIDVLPNAPLTVQADLSSSERSGTLSALMAALAADTDRAFTFELFNGLLVAELSARIREYLKEVPASSLAMVEPALSGTVISAVATQAIVDIVDTLFLAEEPLVSGLDVNTLKLIEDISSSRISLSVGDELGWAVSVEGQPVLAGFIQPLVSEPASFAVVRSAAGLSDTTYGVLKGAALNLEHPSAELLDVLVDQALITSAERKAVLLSSGLRAFLGDNPALIAATLAGNTSASTPLDLAYKTESYWKGLLEANDGELLPSGKTSQAFAAEIVAAFEKRYAQQIVLHRSFSSDKSSTVGLLTSGLASQIATSYQYVHGRKIVTIPSQSSGGEEMRTTGTPTNLMTMASMLNTYRHLGLAEVATDDELDINQRKEEIQNRLDAFATFYTNNGAEALLSARILTNDTEGVDWTGVDEGFKSNIRKQVMAVQRSFALGGSPASVESLTNAGLDSALDIARLGKTEFKAAVDLEDAEAERIYGNAERMALATLNLMESFRVILNSDREHTNVESSERRVAYRNLLKDMDGFSDLFGPQNGCDADDCQTVLSPAAYFVDLMRFVDEHFTPLLDGDTLAGHPLGELISLQARRPDLWTLPLNCENTKELIPYLNIVVEVLESYLPSVISTFSPTVPETYEFLATGADSFGSPTSIPSRELKLYLEHFQANPYEVYTTIAPAQKTSDKAWRLSLGLTKAEFDNLVQTKGVAICKFFGKQPNGDGTYPTSAYAAGGMADYPMSAFLKRTRITREEFLQLKAVRSIPISGLDYHSTGSALESGEEFIDGLDVPQQAEKVFRWIRLSRAVSLGIADLDLLLTALKSVGAVSSTDPQFTSGVLTALARALRIRDRLKLSLEETAAMIGYMPHSDAWDSNRDTGKEAPLCDRLFRTEKLFSSAAGAGSLNINAVGLPQTSYIMSALGISEGELFSLLKYMGQSLKTVTPAETATVAGHRVLGTFTQLFRYAVLSRKLAIPVDGMLTLFRCGGYANIFGTSLPSTASAAVAAMDALLNVLDLADEAKKTALTLQDAAYVLLNDTDATHPASCTIDDARQVFQATANIRGTAVNRLKNALADKMGVSLAQIEYLLLFCPQGYHLGEVAGKLPSPPPPLPIDPVGESYEDYQSSRTTDPEKDQYSLSGKMGPKDDDQPVGHGPRGGFFEEAEEGYTWYPLFNTPTPTPPRTRDGIVEVALPTGITLADLQVQMAQEQLFSIMQELYGFQWLCKRLKINTADLAAIKQNKTVFGLTNEANLSFIDLIRIERFKKYFDGRIELFVDLCKASAKTGTEREIYYVQPLAGLLQKEQLLVSSSDALLLGSGAFSGGLMARISALEGIMSLTQKLGISAGVLLSVIAKDDAHADIVAARNTALQLFKARYPDERTREAVLNPYTARILSWKRDAICEYILNWADTGWLNMNTADDIYAHLLLDVQIGEAVMTSRLVCAISSVQLYVQRCLLFLETMEDGKGISPKEDNYTKWTTASQEWEWRKNYRVWEANRKVFLYPENFLEPDLRDDKTPLFKTFGDAVAQQKITEETAEAAYMDYMHGLSQLGNMVYIGAYKTGLKTEPTGTYYLMAKSGGDPKKLYYRTLAVNNVENPGIWGPWLEIPATADPGQMSAIQYRRDLFFFWMTLVEKRKTELGSDGSSGKTTLSYTKTLHWISYNQDTKKWTQEQKQDLPTTPLQNDPDSLQWYEDYIKPDLNVFPVVFEGALYVMHYGGEHLAIKRTTSATNHVDVGDMNGITMKYNLYANVFERVWISNHSGGYYGSASNADGADSGQPEIIVHNELYYPLFANLFKPSDWDFNIVAWNEGGQFRGFMVITKERPFSIYKLNADVGYGEAILAALDLNKMMYKGHRPQLGIPAPWTDGYNPAGFIPTPINYSHLHRIGSTTEAEFQQARRDFVSEYEMIFKDESRTRADVEINDYYNANRPKLPKRILQVVPDSQGSNNLMVIPTGNLISGNLIHFNSNTYLALFHEDPTRRFFVRLNSPSIKALETSMASGLVSFLSLATQTTAAAPGFDSRIQASGGQSWFTLPPVVNSSELGRLDTIRTNYLDFHGSYGNYFQEMFLHMPWYLGSRLNAEGKFKEAKDWYEKIFDPTKKESLVRGATSPGTLDQGPAQNWIYMPFRDMYALTAGDTQPEAYKSLYLQILNNTQGEDDYRKSPFSPYAIARTRPTAMAKAVVMRYIDNLLDWADSLFTRDTTESVNEAMMLYILANQILGERPYSTGACNLADADMVTYQSIDSDAGADEFFYTVESDLLLESGGTMETFSERSGGGHAFGAANGIFNASTARVGTGSSRKPVFGIPKNLEFYGYWDRVSDRLFKIRNSMNIDGVRRQLALFAPPIDPRLLIRLRAAGMTLDDALALSGNLSHYRFGFMLEKAKQYTQTVQSFGGALLAALEKKDAEELQLLRSVHEQNLLQLTLDVKKKQVEVAQNQLDGLLESKANVEQRRDYYGSLIENGLTGWERTQQVSKHLASYTRLLSSGLRKASTITHLIPRLGSPFAMLFGGTEVGHSLDSASDTLQSMAQVADDVASSAGLEATFQRRAEEWKQQKRTAEQELRQMEKQILASEVQLHIAEQELVIHQKNMDQADELELLYKDKFTNLGLYTYMATKLQKLYREAYGMAAKMAYDAQSAYAFERDDDERRLGYIQPDNFSTERVGLLAGEALMLQLQQMEAAYLNSNPRTMEVSQTFSLASLFPEGLLALQQTGKCDFALPEEAFDLLYPGQYKRLIKGVRVTVPCVVGPYTNVPLVLRLKGAYVRKVAGSYKPVDDTTNTHELPIPITPLRTMAIATSQGQYDSGMFEFNFRDERYLPFENEGAVSHWSLELPDGLPPFDYSTISDVLLHISYSAKEDGVLRTNVNGRLRKQLLEQIIGYQNASPVQGLYRLISLKETFPDAYHQLTLSHTTTVEITASHLPFFLKGENLKLNSAALLVKGKEVSGSYDAWISRSGIASPTTTTSPAWLALTNNVVQREFIPTDLTLDPAAVYTVHASANTLTAADDILLLLNYAVALS